MAIDPKTGMEEVKPVINTEVMKQYNPNYNPNEWVWVSWIVGTPEKPTISASVDPTQVNIGGTNPNIAQQPNEQAKTNLNATISPVSTPQTTSAPPVIEKTTTITPQGEKVVKKEIPTPDFNIWAWREQDILKNLNEGFTNAPYLFQNQDTFRSSYWYATADDTKKRMLDAFFQAKSAQQNNPDALFQQIISNQTIQNPSIRNTPAFKAAQSRASALSINSWLTAKELSDQIKNGSITIGSQAYKDLQTSNPQLVQNAERLNAINTWVGKRVDANTIESNVGNNIIKNVPKEEVPTLQGMLANNEQVKTALDNSKATKTRVDTIQDTLDNLEDDIKKQYEGKDVTAWYIQAVISEKSKPLIRELNTLNRTYSNQLAELQYYSGIVKDDYETSKAQQQDERNFAQQKELATFQNTLATESKKLDYAYQNSRDVQNFKQDLQKMGITDALAINRDKLNFAQQKELASIQNKYQNSRDVQNYAQDIGKLQFAYQNDPSNIAKNMENMSNLPSAPVTASGTQSNVMVGGKNIIVDSVSASGLENANNELKAAGIPVVAASWFRDQTATIRSMADRYKIAFNESNPSETAAALRKAWHQVANPGNSKHESGMAIDVYADSKLGKVTPQQEAILNKNGWFSAGIPWDAGHFEYKWVQSQTLKKIPESAQKRIDGYSDDYTKNPNVQSAFKFAPLLRQYNNIDVKSLSSSQRQGIISDYAKALDPDSVVREGEYATVAKYSSSFGEKTLSEINQFLSGNWTLSDNAAKKVIDAINSRGKNYIEQEKNIRNQYIDKINRISGDNRGEQELVFPDYANAWNSQGQQSQTQAQNPTDVDAILNEWNTRNQ